MDSNKKIKMQMIKNQTKQFTKESYSVGSFDKFVPPFIRQVFPSIVPNNSIERDTPLKKLVEQSTAEHHPDDPDWEEWKAGILKKVEDAVIAGASLSDELRSDFDNLRLFEPTEAARHSIISVQPMTRPGGGIQFYRSYCKITSGPQSKSSKSNQGI